MNYLCGGRTSGTKLAHINAKETREANKKREKQGKLTCFVPTVRQLSRLNRMRYLSSKKHELF